MPNWCEGSLKVRGRLKDVKRFFLENIKNNANAKEGDVPVIDRSSCEDEFFIEFGNEPYINGTTRAFILSDFVEMHEKEYGTACVNFKQAWGDRTT